MCAAADTCCGRWLWTETLTNEAFVLQVAVVLWPPSRQPDHACECRGYLRNGLLVLCESQRALLYVAAERAVLSGSEF
jgi:hypothetical protein